VRPLRARPRSSGAARRPTQAAPPNRRVKTHPQAGSARGWRCEAPR
jgi:hypothetical protein